MRTKCIYLKRKQSSASRTGADTTGKHLSKAFWCSEYSSTFNTYTSEKYVLYVIKGFSNIYIYVLFYILYLISQVTQLKISFNLNDVVYKLCEILYKRISFCTVPHLAL